MKLEQIGIPLLRRALEVYLERAYGPQKQAHLDRLGIERFAQVSDALSSFVDESGRGGTASGSRRYILRIGNGRYPFMKFVLQEYLIPGEFFFTVDTHDQMELKASVPDYEAWLELKQFNRDLKAEIEAEWERESIPTFTDLKKLVQADPQLARRAAAPPGGRTILVVDDERAIADSVATLLRGEGYRVVTAYDGAEALRQIQDVSPDLILMDYEMPKIDGIQLCGTIRSLAPYLKVPILLATACSMDLSDVKVADGFLVKPYQKDILFSFIHHLLR